jgi:hypothetical protein
MLDSIGTDDYLAVILLGIRTVSWWLMLTDARSAKSFGELSEKANVQMESESSIPTDCLSLNVSVT